MSINTLHKGDDNDDDDDDNDNSNNNLEKNLYSRKENMTEMRIIDI